MHADTSASAPPKSSPRTEAANAEAANAIFTLAIASIRRTSRSQFHAVQRIVGAIQAMLAACLYDMTLDVEEAARALGCIAIVMAWRETAQGSAVGYREGVRLHEVLSYCNDKHKGDGGWIDDLVWEALNLEEEPSTFQAVGLAYAWRAFADGENRDHRKLLGCLAYAVCDDGRPDHEPAEVKELERMIDAYCREHCENCDEDDDDALRAVVRRADATPAEVEALRFIPWTNEPVEADYEGALRLYRENAQRAAVDSTETVLVSEAAE